MMGKMLRAFDRPFRAKYEKLEIAEFLEYCLQMQIAFVAKLTRARISPVRLLWLPILRAKFHQLVERLLRDWPEKPAWQTNCRNGTILHQSELSASQSDSGRQCEDTFSTLFECCLKSLHACLGLRPNSTLLSCLTFSQREYRYLKILREGNQAVEVSYFHYG